LPDQQSQRVVHACLNSSTYYLFFSAYTDGRHINPSDVTAFPLDLENLARTLAEQLVALSEQLEIDMARNTTERRKSGLLIESVDSAPTKPILDAIDRTIAVHYGLTPEELDYILNYDIKYRLGQPEEPDGGSPGA
jgi:hypothetical protein